MLSRCRLLRGRAAGAVSAARRAVEASSGGGGGYGGPGGSKPKLKWYGLTARSADGGARTACRTHDGHAIASDLPRKSGGGGGAAEPVYHLLAALCGCEAATAAFVARRMRPVPRAVFTCLSSGVGGGSHDMR